MNFAVFSGQAVHRQPQFFHYLTQLGVNVLPLAHAQIVEEIAAAQFAELCRRQRFLLHLQVIPQVYECQEIRVFVGKATMFFIGRLLFVHRTLARILNRQRGGNDHHFTYAAVFLCFQHHARQTRIHRQLRQLTTERCQRIATIDGVINGVQIFQQTDAILNIAFVRRLNKRECGDIAQPQRGHL
ncbi:hypothetical protein SRABI106_01994 [Rahnella aquatilis]|nr:hypothetical protein SRABI106_01994 [Rahnella aquatilis]